MNELQETMKQVHANIEKREKHAKSTDKEQTDKTLQKLSQLIKEADAYGRRNIYIDINATFYIKLTQDVRMALHQTGCTTTMEWTKRWNKGDETLAGYTISW